jgi:hypothetical protein
VIDRSTARVLALVIVICGVGAKSHSQRAAGEERAVDDARAAAAGIRKLAGRHLVLYTDLASAAEIDALPAVFDRAVPLWAKYFDVDASRTRDWQVRAYLIGDRRPFDALGLMPAGRDEFPHGLSVGNEIWLHEQPTAYYRRHLLLHEGTHAFMWRFLGGCGPGWYMEGIAELLATHRLEKKGTGVFLLDREADVAPSTTKRLPSPFVALNIMPRDRREVPMLGRIKLVRDAFAADRALALPAVMQIDNRRQLGVEAYAWCWAAAKFLDSHPQYRERFRRLTEHVQEENFNDVVRREFADDWPELAAEWQAFVATLDYGYEFERMAIEFERGTPLSRKRQTATVRADRGWQSSRVWLEARKEYRVTARGRYQIAVERTDAGEQVWMCEPGGVTIEYHNGRPLGVLLGAIVPDGAARPAEAGLARPIAIGLGATIKPREGGTLYLRVNDSAARLGDNRGALTIEIED